MSNYEVKKVHVMSVVRNFPIVFGILGAVIGIFTFFLFPTEIAANLGFGAKLLSWLIFVILYTLIMVAGLMLVAWLYNWVVSKVGGVVIGLEQHEE